MSWISRICILSFGWRRLLIMLIAGGIAALSMPPFLFLPLLFVTFPLWVWCLDGAERSSGLGLVFGPSFWIGFSFGLGYFAVALHWVGFAFLVDGGLFVFAIPFAVLGLAAILAVFWGLASSAAHFFWSNSFMRIISLSVFLALAEFLRGTLFTGFPFDVLGYALTANVTMMQLASVIGVYGLTLLAAVLGFLPALVWPADERSLSKRLMPLFMIFVLLAAQLSFGQYRLNEIEISQRDDMRLRLVQPGVLQAEKWQPASAQIILERLLAMSASRTGPDDNGLSDITHLIWPEAALPFFLSDFPEALVRIADMLPDGTTLITGAPRRQLAANLQELEYNSILAIGSNGETLSSYDKTHLVPFGEYLPFESLLNGIGIKQFVTTFKGWSAGESRNLMQTPTTPPFLPLICYEAIFSGALFSNSPDGAADKAQFILNLTNDAWFDNSIGPAQSFQHARLRAVEQGLPMVRVANTGKSAIIDPLGRISSVLEPGEIGIVDADMPNRIEPTFFSRYLNLPFFGALLLGFGFVAITRLRSLRP
ncbi:MAG: apolipoprotein N-acyltransferase [Devosiaceae bacterium]|nr:apolipoprotein N-acyltransferase [Devosiaceae bacterium]